MTGLRKNISVLVIASGIAAIALSRPALADRQDLGACGTFDFSEGLNCKIEVSGGCTAKCTPIQFEAACKGGCTATATQTNCTNNCGTTCIQQCNPAKLDCFVGCHGECDAPLKAQCESKGGSTDCQAQATAHCDMHCQDSCKIPPSNCQEHCTKCCTGSCDTQLNFDCDVSCMAKVKGGCDVSCQKPEGGIFCNGQFVNATDVKACITYLATKNIKVDVTASGSLNCTNGDCSANGAVGVKNPIAGSGCSAGSMGGSNAGGLLPALAVAIGLLAARRRRPA